MSAAKTVGIIGAGTVVFNAHLPLFKAMGLEVCWILDANKIRAKSAAEAYGVPLALGADELDKTSPADIVLVACPYGSRKPYFDFLRGREGALYIEKPVARSVHELEEICRLRPDYAIAAGFSRRCMGVTNIVKGLIEDRIFGKLRRVKSMFGTATIISSGGGFAKDVKLAGGGQLMESAIHNIDAICYMAGIRQAAVKRCKMIHENGFDLHTEADLQLLDEHGCEIEMELLVTCFRSTQYEIEMEFDSAKLTFSLFKPRLPEIRTGRSRRVYQLLDHDLKDYPRQVFDMLHVFWTDFLNGWEAQKQNYTNACSTSATASIIEQLYLQGIASH
jgi:predicted dehydrogenase